MKTCFHKATILAWLVRCGWFHIWPDFCQPVSRRSHLTVSSNYPSPAAERGRNCGRLNEVYRRKQIKAHVEDQIQPSRRTCFGAMVVTEISVRLWVTLRQVKETRNGCYASPTTLCCVRFWLQRNFMLAHHGANDPLWAGSHGDVQNSQFIDRRQYTKECAVTERNLLSITALVRHYLG